MALPGISSLAAAKAADLHARLGCAFVPHITSFVINEFDRAGFDLNTAGRKREAQRIEELARLAFQPHAVNIAVWNMHLPEDYHFEGVLFAGLQKMGHGGGLRIAVFTGHGWMQNKSDDTSSSNWLCSGNFRRNGDRVTFGPVPRVDEPVDGRSALVGWYYEGQALIGPTLGNDGSFGDDCASSDDGAEPAGETRYFLFHKHSGNVLDGNGDRLYFHMLNGGDYQKWSLEDAGGGFHFIHHKLSGQVLSGDTNGRNLFFSSFTGTDFQKWHIEEVEGAAGAAGAAGAPSTDGLKWCFLRHKLSGRVLDGTGTNLYFHDFNGGDYQMWAMSKAYP